MTQHSTLQPRSPWQPPERPPEPRVEVYEVTGAWGRVVEVTRDLDTNERSYRVIQPGSPPSVESSEPGVRAVGDRYARFNFLPSV